MTAKSAYAQIEKRHNEKGYCLPLAIDSILKVSELPDEYYDLCYKDGRKGKGDRDATISYILKNFFDREPRPGTDIAGVAEFNAFGSSPQEYMPDASYDGSGYMEELQEFRVTPKQLRLVNLLRIARDNSCNALFTDNQGTKEHVSALDLVDVGKQPDEALYFVRDYGNIKDEVLYRSIDLSGIFKTLGIKQKAAKYAPLPEVQRPYFPAGQSSWELTIFPPDPKL